MKRINSLKRKIYALLRDRSGDQLVSMLVIILIVIIVGGIALSLFSDSFSEIWSSMVDKMKSTFSL
ncbi:MAG: hypothetical protein PHE79_11670 [Eubacteriales bacterium]|nr:hypothetical protein [Eubacteriales bacterium]